MRHEQPEDLNFLEAMVGLVFEPGETAETLFAHERPPYGLTLILCLLLSFFVPIVSQIIKYGYSVYNSDAIVSLIVIIFFTLLIFLFAEGLFLQLLGFDFSPARLFACVAYATAPMLICIWLIYGFNYLTNGRLTLITLFITGYGSVDDHFLQVMPYALFISQLLVLVVFFHSLKYMVRLQTFNALVTTVFSLIPFYGSLIVGLFFGELARPGTIHIFLKILNSPIAMTEFGQS